MEKHKEIIECPECGKRQTAEVFHPLPWWSYIHDCIYCKYTIMESEWICVDKESINPTFGNTLLGAVPF